MIQFPLTSNRVAVPQGTTHKTYNSVSEAVCSLDCGRVRYAIGEALHSRHPVASHLRFAVGGFPLSERGLGMSRIDNPERRAFIRANLVDNPLDKAGVNFWWNLFEQQRRKADRGEPTILEPHWMDFIDRNPMRASVDQLAGSIRHEYVMTLWDKEHSEPPEGEVDWQTGRW